MNEEYPEALKAMTEASITVVDRPELKSFSANKDEEFRAELEVFISPDVTLGEYMNLTVEVPPMKAVTDEEVESRIQQSLSDHTRLVEVLDRPVAEGDTVKLNYRGTVDGVAFEGGTAEDQTLVIGSHQFIPGFEEQMVGMCVAEERDLSVTFPADYHAAELAGKEAVFHVKVNSISVSETPELTDDFVADTTDWASVEEYRAGLRAQMEAAAKRNHEVAIENAAVDKAVDNATVDIPKAMIDEELELVMQGVERQMQSQGFTMEVFLQYLGKTREEYAENYRADAERRVRMRLVMNAIVAAVDPEVLEEDIMKEAEDQAQRLGRDPETFKAGLTDEQREALKMQARIQKVADMMAHSATVIEKEPEAAEAEADAETPAEESAETPDAE